MAGVVTDATAAAAGAEAGGSPGSLAASYKDSMRSLMRAAKRARRESGADGPPVLRPASAAVGKPERRETLVVNDDAPTVAVASEASAPAAPSPKLKPASQKDEAPEEPAPAPAARLAAGVRARLRAPRGPALPPRGYRRGRTIVSGLIHSSNCSAVRRPSSTPASRRVVPSAWAFLAIWAALS